MSARAERATSALTDLALAVDQSVPGWGPRALVEGAGALEATGRPRLAAELRRQGGCLDDPLVLLSRYLRLSLTAGAASPLPATAMHRGGPARAGLYPGRVPDAVRKAWDAGGHEEPGASPAVSGDRVVFGCDDGHLLCVDLDRGETLWGLNLGAVLDSSPAIARGRVLLTHPHRGLCCFDLADGTLAWEHPFGVVSDSSPAIVGERVLVTADDGRLRCVVLESGALLWASEALESPVAASSPAAEGEYAVFTTLDGFVRCVALTDGRLLWQVFVGDGIEHTPVIAEGAVLISDTGDISDENGATLHCFELESGQARWKHTTGFGRHSPCAVGSGRVVFGDLRGDLHVLDLRTGAPQQSPIYLTARIRSGPLLAGERAVVALRDGHLRGVDLDSGQTLWRYAPDEAGAFYSSPVLTEDGRILIGDGEGTMYCLEPAPAPIKQESPWLSP